MGVAAKKSILYAAALLSPELPTAKRLEILAKYISPRPGSEIVLDEYAVKELGHKDKERGLVYGQIEVNPPKGICFTVTKSLDQADIEVCKKTILRWQFKDLDRDTGKLNWQIRTGASDFGTPISWNTKYMIARIIPAGFEFNQANSTPVFITGCQAAAADPNNFIGRRVTLNLLNGESWTIRFPDKDELIPPYEPTPLPPSPEDEKKTKKPAHGEEGGSEGHDKKTKPEPTKAPPPPPPEAWTLSTRRGFIMPVSNVISGGSAAAVGSKGKCRYQYDATPGDFDTGRIECHYGDNFLYFYTRLPCLKFIQADKQGLPPR